MPEAKRHGMRDARLHSRLVAGLKIGLPLLALFMLSTMFLLSRDRTPEPNLPFRSLLQEGDPAEEQIGRPHFSGITTQGDMLTLTARRAHPDGAHRIVAEDLNARLRLNGGGEIVMQSPNATLHSDQGEAQLAGGVRIQSAMGYIIETEGLTAQLNQTQAQSHGPVTATGPVGTLKAGLMQILPAKESTDVQILFTQGVNLIYLPQIEQKARP